MYKSRAVGVRINLDVLTEIKRRAAYRNISVNKWINNVIKSALRPSKAASK